MSNDPNDLQAPGTGPDPGVTNKRGPGLIGRLAAALFFHTHDNQALPIVGRVAFNARTHAKSLQEAIAAHALVRLVQFEMGQTVQAPGTGPDPGIVATLRADCPSYPWDLVLTMAETGLGRKLAEELLAQEQTQLFGKADAP